MEIVCLGRVTERDIGDSVKIVVIFGSLQKRKTCTAEELNTIRKNLVAQCKDHNVFLICGGLEDPGCQYYDNLSIKNLFVIDEVTRFTIRSSAHGDKTFVMVPYLRPDARSSVVIDNDVDVVFTNCVLDDAKNAICVCGAYDKRKFIAKQQEDTDKLAYCFTGEKLTLTVTDKIEAASHTQLTKKRKRVKSSWPTKTKTAGCDSVVSTDNFEVAKEIASSDRDDVVLVYTGKYVQQKSV